MRRRGTDGTDPAAVAQAGERRAKVRGKEGGRSWDADSSSNTLGVACAWLTPARKIGSGDEVESRGEMR